MSTQFGGIPADAFGSIHLTFPHLSTLFTSYVAEPSSTARDVATVEATCRPSAFGHERRQLRLGVLEAEAREQSRQLRSLDHDLRLLTRTESHSRKNGRQDNQSSPLFLHDAYHTSDYFFSGILPVVKYCSTSSSVRPFVSGRKNAAVMK